MPYITGNSDDSIAIIMRFFVLWNSVYHACAYNCVASLACSTHDIVNYH